MQWHCFLLLSNRLIICSILLSIRRMCAVLSCLEYVWNISLSRQVSHFSTLSYVNSNNSIFVLISEDKLALMNLHFSNAKEEKKNDCICHSHDGNLIRQHTVIWSIRMLQTNASRAVWDRTWTFCLEKGHLMHFFTSMVKSFAFWSWWRHQMETFSALLALCAGNSPVPGEFPALRPVTRSFDFLFDLRLN